MGKRFEIQKMINGWFLYHIHPTNPQVFGPFHRKELAIEKMEQLKERKWYQFSPFIK